MAGRTTDVSTSSFKPLSLNEIMMVPLAKQKMEDELLAGTAKFGELSASTLGVDEAEANEMVSGFKERASQLSTDVLERGVSREQFNKLRGLRSEVTREFGKDGFLGRAIANKQAASQYAEDMLKKDNRQGNSRADAQKWAAYNVGKFKGTRGQNGEFNSFSGSEMAEWVDEDKQIKDVIAGVAEKVDPVTMRAINYGGLPEFTKLYQNGTIKSKDYNTIMGALKTNALTSPKLLAHLQQQAFFTGEKNPLDMGHFVTEEIPVKDALGNRVIDKATGKYKTKPTRRFQAGKSRYGMKMAGAGATGAYSNPNLTIMKIKDDIAIKLAKDGLDMGKAVKLSSLVNGELNDVTRPDLEDLQEIQQLAKVATKEMHSEFQGYEQELLSNSKEFSVLEGEWNKLTPEQKQDPANMKDYTMKKEAILRADTHWSSLEKQYNDSAVKHKNAENQVNYLYDQARESMTTEQKENFAIYQELSDNVPGFGIGDEKSDIAALEKWFVTSGNEDYLDKVKAEEIAQMPYNEIDDDNKQAMLMSKYLSLNGLDVNNNAKADRSLLTLLGSDERAYDKNITKRAMQGKIAMDRKVDNILAAQPKGQSFNMLTANDIGAAKAPAIARLNKLLKTDWNEGVARQSATMAFNGGLVTDDIIHSLFDKASKKGYTYTPSITDGSGWDSHGNKFINVAVKNNDTGEVSSIQVINNNNRDAELIVADQLEKSGSLAQQKTAKHIKASWAHMRDVKASGMMNQPTGIIAVPIEKINSDGSTTRQNITWTKHGEAGVNNGGYFTAEIGGVPLNGGQAIYGENDMAIKIYDYVQNKLKASSKKKLVKAANKK